MMGRKMRRIAACGLAAVMLLSVSLAQVTEVAASDVEMAPVEDIPDFDIWMADAMILGIDNIGNGIYPMFQSFQDPMYKELGGYILDNEPLLTMSSAWSVMFNSEYRNQFANEQKYIYEIILMGYLKYNAESSGSKSLNIELENNVTKFSTKIYSVLAKEIEGIGFVNGMRVDEAIRYLNNVDTIKNLDSAITYVQSGISETKSLIEACSEYLALQQAKDERIALLKSARDACQSYSSPNQHFIDAANDLINALEGTDLGYVQGEALDYLWNQACDTVWSILEKGNPILETIDLTVSGLDMCFDTSNSASNNLKLALLYTADCYLKQGMIKSCETYLSDKTSANAQRFYACFQAYAEFQMYGNTYANTWLEDYVNNNIRQPTSPIGFIFYREQIESAQELIAITESQVKTRKVLLKIIERYGNIYFGKYADDEWEEEMVENVSVTGISFQDPEVTLTHAEDILVVGADIAPSNATNKNITYTSSDPSVLTVPENGGFAMINGSGTATITATSEDGGYTATQTVYVGNAQKLGVIDSGTCGENLRWALYSDGLLYIWGEGEMTDWPKGYNKNLPPWYSNGNVIKEVILEDGVTSIGSGTFRDCRNLAGIELPVSLTRIGDNAFEDCSSLASIELPAGVTSIGWQAFGWCSSLARIELPEGMTSIKPSMFFDCSSLASIELPAGVTSIESCAFYGCSSLASIELPAGVTSIENQAFSGCSSLASIELPAGVTSIGFGTFEGCSSLASIELPAGVTSIEFDTFSGCSSLARIELPAGVTSIGGRVFEGCSSLASIELPAGVTSIGGRAFGGCSSLASIELPAGVTSIEDSAFSGCSSLVSIELPAGVTNIGECAFYHCRSLAGIELPAGVTSIGYRAFSGCSSLASIELPAGVTSISGYAFDGCSSLASIELPDGLTSIEWYAFYGCNNLQSIRMNGNAPMTGYEVFYGCPTEMKIYVPKDATGYDVSPWTDYTVIYGKEESADYISGDVNEDKAVDIRDCRLLLRGICGKITLTDRQILIVDVVEDGQADVRDLRKLLLYVCGKIVEL